MLFLDPALLLRRRLAKHLPEVLAQLPIQRSSAALGNEDDVVFAVQCRVARPALPIVLILIKSDKWQP